MEIKTLSSIENIPFTNVLETFFDDYTVDEEIECYQFVFCPYGTATNFDDLNKINFKSKVVIFNVIDTFIDLNDNVAIDELAKFCKYHPEQNFIISSCHLNLQRELELPNLYLDSYMPSSFSETFMHCEKKDLTNRWVMLNSNTKLHRMLAVCYLLSKDYSKNGDISFNVNAPTLVSHKQYRNIDKIPTYDLRTAFATGYARFKAKDFNFLDIPKIDYDDLRVSNNYNNKLLPVYENVGVEIITGTMFFERTPVLSEKEIQSVYAQNFPIYLNGVGMAKEMKKFFDIDIFEDIVDHSYDEIEDHFERIAAAIDRNEKLLNGSTNIKELWYDNQKRFEENCKKMDSMLRSNEYQKTFNYERIKKGLEHFGVSVVKN